MSRYGIDEKKGTINDDKDKTGCLCFQEVMRSSKEQSNDNDFAANAFFELANAPIVTYRIDKDTMIKIYQDHQEACGQHTGGIVWETSYLLLNYLRETYSKGKYSCGNTVLEVGAGCGLLGLGIYHSKIAKQVIMTETDLVLPNLTRNVEKNYSKKTDKVRVCALDWTCYKKDCENSIIAPHSIDMIVGTDVVFSTRYVRPLLETLQYLAHQETIILLCLQERCPDSHRLLLDSAEQYGLMIHEISKQVTDTPTCEWGKGLECCILQLQIIPKKLKDTNRAQGKPKRKRARTEDNDAF